MLRVSRLRSGYSRLDSVESSRVRGRGLLECHVGVPSTLNEELREAVGRLCVTDDDQRLGFKAVERGTPLTQEFRREHDVGVRFLRGRLLRELNRTVPTLEDRARLSPLSTESAQAASTSPGPALRQRLQ